MNNRELFTKNRLFCPGPTPVPEQVLAAASETSIYHRSDEFYKIFRECMDMLAPIFGSKNLPLILTSSGTGGLEAAVVNLTDPGDQVAVVNGGKFGERWDKLTRTYGCDVATLEIPWGTAPTVEQILELTGRRKDTKALFLQANETSTGAYYKIETLIPAVRKHFKGLIVVDCISSLCAHEMRMDDWEIDCVVAGSQKGFGLPPGLAFISLSDRAWNGLSKRPRFYFDLKKERDGQAGGRSAWTPALSLIMGLHAALKIMHATGLPAMYSHHDRLARASRAFAAAVGLELLCKDSPSNSLTSMSIPDGIDGSKVIKDLRARYQTFFAGGQDQLKGKVVRYSHLGFVSMFDVIDGLVALEFVLNDAGHRFDFGAGVKAAMAALR
jgi:aspartate aminotransferase-like enzyme